MAETRMSEKIITAIYDAIKTDDESTDGYLIVFAIWCTEISCQKLVNSFKYNGRIILFEQMQS